MPLYVPASGKELRPSEARVRKAIYDTMRFMEKLDPVAPRTRNVDQALGSLATAIDVMFPYPIDAPTIFGADLVGKLTRKRHSKASIQSAWTWLVQQHKYLAVALWRYPVSSPNFGVLDGEILSNPYVLRWTQFSDETWQRLYTGLGIAQDKINLMPVFINYCVDQVRVNALPMERMIFWVSPEGRRRWQEFGDSSEHFVSDDCHVVAGIVRRKIEARVIREWLWDEIAKFAQNELIGIQRDFILYLCSLPDHEATFPGINQCCRWREVNTRDIRDKYKGSLARPLNKRLRKLRPAPVRLVERSGRVTLERIPIVELIDC